MKESIAALHDALERNEPAALATMVNVQGTPGTHVVINQEVNVLLTGPLSFGFWAGVVLVGLVLPLGVEFGMILRGVEKPAQEVAIVLALMVLVGGLVLRAIVVFGRQI